MRISCDACGSSYNVSDDKVRGRRVKVRCKSCRAAIVVDGLSMAADEAAAAMGDDGDDDAATRVADARVGFAGMRAPPPPAMPPPPAAPPPARSGVWSVDFGENDQRDMGADEIARAYRNGEITEEHHVWAEGMGDWTAVLDVPELRRAIEAQRASRPPPRRQSEAPTPFAAARAARPAAAVRAPGRARAGVDLFGAAASAGSEDEVVSSAQDGQRHAQVEAAATGQRNESSVLFSLNSLKSTLQASPGVRPGRSAPRAVDDLIGLGGSSSPLFTLQANQALLSAPVVEAPPPPPEADLGAVVPSLDASAEPPRRKRGLIIALAAAGVLLVGGSIAATMAFTAKSEPAKLAALDGKTDKAVDKTPEQKGDSKASAAEAPKAADPASSAPAPEASAGAPGDPKKELTEADRKRFFAALEKEKGAKAEEPPEEKKEEKKGKAKAEEEKDDPPPAAAPSDQPFSKAAAMSALNSAAGAAGGCKKPGGPTGRGRATVTFAPSGRATSAVISGGSFGGTSVGGCIASAFRRAKVPPFSGGSVTVGKSFNVPD